MDERERFAKGLEVRRAVLGEKHVNRSLEKVIRSPKNFRIWSRGMPGESCGPVRVCHGIRGA